MGSSSVLMTGFVTDGGGERLSTTRFCFSLCSLDFVDVLVLKYCK